MSFPDSVSVLSHVSSVSSNSCVEAQKKMNAAIRKFNDTCQSESSNKVAAMKELLAAWYVVKPFLEEPNS